MWKDLQQTHMMTDKCMCEAQGPEIEGVLLSLDCFTTDSKDLAPVTSLLTSRRMTEARRFSLTGVVSTPVEQHGSQ
jgi:hypothetical protein